MTVDTDQHLREQMVRISKKLEVRGLNRGTSGNLSVRVSPETWLVTPSGLPVDNLTTSSMVLMDSQGAPISQGKPSSEWRFHCDIYLSRLDVNAVVHTHSRFATAFSCLHQNIPAFHYMIACAGDDIRCSLYTIFGSQQLSDFAIEALKDRRACLLGNHGMIAVGKNLDAAFTLAREVESLCEQYWTALQLGTPKILTTDEMSEVLEKFKTYGQHRSSD